MNKLSIRDELFIKISNREALLNMKKGTWWFRHPAYFQFEEIKNGNKYLGDKEESLIKQRYFTKTHTEKTIQTNWGKIPPQEIFVTYKEFRPSAEIDSERILCLYKLKTTPNGLIVPVSHDMANFGDFFSIVKTSELYDEIKSKEESLERYDMTYLPNNFSGLCGQKSKRDSYKHQNEHRFYLSSNFFNEQIIQNSSIEIITKELGETYSKQYNQPLDIMIAADRKSKELEMELCKKKASYYEEIYTSPNLISEPTPISILFNSNTLQELLTACL